MNQLRILSPEKLRANARAKVKAFQLEKRKREHEEKKAAAAVQAKTVTELDRKLAWAINEDNDLEAGKKLIDNGASLSKAIRVGIKHRAANRKSYNKEKDEKIGQILRELKRYVESKKGAKRLSPEEQEELNSRLFLAANGGKVDEVKKLLRAGAAVDAGYVPYGSSRNLSALAAAAIRGKRDVVRVLCKAGADLNIKYKDGQTVLMILAQSGSLLKVNRALIEAGADLNLRDNEGKTALMHAAQRRNDRVARVLIDSGADLNVTDNDGNTALMLSASCNLVVARMLAKAGADVNVENQNGDTALDLAGNKHKTAEMLKEHGAKLGEDLP